MTKLCFYLYFLIDFNKNKLILGIIFSLKLIIFLLIMIKNELIIIIIIFYSIES
jgi:hypothetical protein